MSKTSETKNRILGLLAKEDLRLADIYPRLNLSPATVLQHLKELEDIGAIKKVDDPHFKNVKFYSLNDKETFQSGNTISLGEKSKTGLLLMSVVLVSAIAIGAAALLSHAWVHTGKGTFEVQLTDPPDVPAGTQALFVNYSSVYILVGGSSGRNWIGINTTGNVDLMSLTNRSFNIAQISLPSNTQIYGARLVLDNSELIMDNLSYPVKLRYNNITVSTPSMNVEAGRFSGVLLELLPIVNETDNSTYYLNASMKAMAMDNMS